MITPAPLRFSCDGISVLDVAGVKDMKRIAHQKQRRAFVRDLQVWIVLRWRSPVL